MINFEILEMLGDTYSTNLYDRATTLGVDDYLESFDIDSTGTEDDYTLSLLLNTLID